MDSDLLRLPGLLKQRYEIDKQIAEVIGRPAEKGHIGAFIAAKVPEIDLLENASHKGMDGRFASGGLAGRSVNVKFLLGDTNVDMVSGPDIDYYLALKGPTGEAKAQYGPRSAAVEAVYLFDAKELARQQQQRQAAASTAASTTVEQRRAAMIYPDANNGALKLTPEQREMLALFSRKAITGRD